MAYTSNFFDSIGTDRVYTASDFSNRFNDLYTNGVIVNNNSVIGTELQVSTVNGTMTVHIATGKAVINGYGFECLSVETLTISTADATNNRIDTIVLELNLNDDYRSIRPLVVAGTPAGSPTEPTLTQNDTVYQLPLANITVVANEINLDNATVTDRRVATTSKGDKSYIDSALISQYVNFSKNIFINQANQAAGLNQLSNMAIDVFGDDTGIDASSTNYTYDGSNKCVAPLAPISITISGSTQIATAQYKFNGASCLFNGTTDYITPAENASLKFGSNDFTIDWWEYRTEGTVVKATIGSSADARAGILIESGTNNHLKLYMSSDLNSWDLASAKDFGAFNLNEWNYYMLVRSGTTMYMFKNGTLVDSFAISNYSIYSGVNSFERIGSHGGGEYFNGYIDSFRVSNVARHTSTFDLPTSDCVFDSNTKFLLRFNGTNGSTAITSDYQYNLISEPLTATTTPTKMFITADETLNYGSITYYGSRDGGTTWTELTPNTLVDITEQPTGTSMMAKAVNDGYQSKINAWAFGWL